MCKIKIFAIFTQKCFIVPTLIILHKKTWIQIRVRYRDPAKKNLGPDSNLDAVILYSQNRKELEAKNYLIIKAPCSLGPQKKRCKLGQVLRVLN
jgi:hypothetical protein